MLFHRKWSLFSKTVCKRVRKKHELAVPLICQKGKRGPITELSGVNMNCLQHIWSLLSTFTTRAASGNENYDEWHGEGAKRGEIKGDQAWEETWTGRDIDKSLVQCNDGHSFATARFVCQGNQRRPFICFRRSRAAHTWTILFIQPPSSDAHFRHVLFYSSTVAYVQDSTSQ